MKRDKIMRDSKLSKASYFLSLQEKKDYNSLYSQTTDNISNAQEN